MNYWILTKRLLACMDSLMCIQIIFLIKALATNLLSKPKLINIIAMHQSFDNLLHNQKAFLLCEFEREFWDYLIVWISSRNMSIHMVYQLNIHKVWLIIKFQPINLIFYLYVLSHAFDIHRDQKRTLNTCCTCKDQSRCAF